MLEAGLPQRGRLLEFLVRQRRQGGVAKKVPGSQAATYVEGIVVQVVEGGGFPFEHGWVEKDGEIIDQTLPSHELVYSPGPRFVGLRGLAEALAIPKPDDTTEDFTIFYRFGWGGADNPEFSQARREAYRLAFGELDEESRSS